MLKHAAELTDSRQRESEAPAIISNFVPVSRLVDPGKRLAPTGARRMRHNRPRPGVLAGVAFDVPRIDVGQAVVHAAFLDEQRGDHARPLTVVAGGVIYDPHAAPSVPTRIFRTTPAMQAQ